MRRGSAAMTTRHRFQTRKSSISVRDLQSATLPDDKSCSPAMRRKQSPHIPRLLQPCPLLSNCVDEFTFCRPLLIAWSTSCTSIPQNATGVSVSAYTRTKELHLRLAQQQAANDPRDQVSHVTLPFPWDSPMHDSSCDARHLGGSQRRCCWTESLLDRLPIPTQDGCTARPALSREAYVVYCTVLYCTS